MYIKNHKTRAGLVNGTLGNVVDWLVDQTDSSYMHPIVDFDGVGIVVVDEDSFSIESQDDETVLAKRIQIPLVLAFAMSIHKSQGQTLELVRVDLGRFVILVIGRVFEYGQAYVAISRCTSLAGLQVFNFDASKIKVHPKAVEFYRQLDNTPFN
jgi:ATP-dependent DNA helicase PIF1